MKKFFYGALALTLAVSLYSCSDDDPDFSVYGKKAYGVQLSDNEFKPIVVFEMPFGDFSAELSNITKGSGIIDGASYKETLYETTVVFNTLAQMGGSYVMNAVSAEGIEKSASLTLDFDQPLGVVDFTDLEYSSDNGLTVKAKTPAENATHYGFYFVPDNASDSWAENILYTAQESGGTFDQEISYKYKSSAMTFDKCLVYPVAIRKNGTTNLVRMGTPRELRKGATSFD